MGIRQITLHDFVSQVNPRYRKKPIIVEARQILEDFEVETKEGTMRGKTGDYVVKGIKGEIYPVDQNIFMATFEKVSDGYREN